MVDAICPCSAALFGSAPFCEPVIFTNTWRLSVCPPNDAVTSTRPPVVPDGVKTPLVAGPPAMVPMLPRSTPQPTETGAPLFVARYVKVGVVLPAAKSGLFTGVILETGRAVGETMAVLMVCGNVVETPRSIFDPIRTLTANIALEMAFAEGDHRSALFVSGLILMALIVALAAAAEIISKERVYG